MPKEDRVITFNSNEVINNGWSYSVYWKKNRFGVHMKSDEATSATIRKVIAAKLGTHIEHIGENLIISSRGEGNLSSCGDKLFSWDVYKVGYTFIQDEEICSKCLGLGVEDIN